MQRRRHLVRRQAVVVFQLGPLDPLVGTPAGIKSINRSGPAPCPTTSDTLEAITEPAAMRTNLSQVMKGRTEQG
jgi:hypothetical protein